MMLRTITWVFQGLPRLRVPSPLQQGAGSPSLCLPRGRGPVSPPPRHNGVKPNREATALKESYLLTRANESQPLLLCKQP